MYHYFTARPRLKFVRLQSSHIPQFLLLSEEFIALYYNSSCCNQDPRTRPSLDKFIIAAVGFQPERGA